MIPTPTDCRRGPGVGWVLFFYGGLEVLGYVWDVPRWELWDD